MTLHNDPSIQGQPLDPPLRSWFQAVGCSDKRFRRRTSVPPCCHHDSRLALVGKPQDDDARVILRRVGTDVREVEVQGDQHSGFLAAYESNVGIRMALHPLVEHGQGVVAVLTEQVSHVGYRFSSTLNSIWLLRPATR